MEKLKILLPKGRIYDNVVELFNGAGISIKLPERAYRPTVNQDDLEAKVMKPQNIGKSLHRYFILFKISDNFSVNISKFTIIVFIYAYYRFSREKCQTSSE